MKQNDLEKLFRDRLRSDRPSVDTDRLWEKLEDKLPSRKKRLPPFWGWLSGIGILFLLGTMIWQREAFFHVNEKELSSVTDIPDLKLAAEANAPQTENSSLLANPTNVAGMQSTLPDPDLNQNALLSDNVLNENRMNAQFESDDNAKAEPGEAVRPAGGSENPVSAPGKSVADIFPDSRSNNRPSSNVNELPRVKQTAAIPANNQKAATTPQVSQPESTISNPDGVVANMRTGPTRLDNPLLLSDEFESGSESLQSLTNMNRTHIFSVTEKKNKVLTMDETPIIQRVSEKNRSHSLSMFMGIGLTGRQLEALTTEGIEEKGYRETTEKMLENWTAALAYRYQPGKWYLEASVSGGWFGEKVNSVSVTTDSLTLDNVVIEQILENGQVIEERRGQVTMIETIERRVISYPKLFHLQAGLGVGRSWALGKNTSLQTGVGVLYSFYHQYHRGTLALQPDLLYELDRNEGNRFSDDGMQFGGYLSADLCRRFSAKWSGSAGLRISAWPKGIAGESAPVQQRYQSYSLTFGIGRHF